MSTLSLTEYLANKLEQKRKEHPSFQLMNQLLGARASSCYNQTAPIEMFEMFARNSACKLKTPKEFVEESWNTGCKNHLMIVGEGGIGKTICLLSLPNMIANKKIPAIYVPLSTVTEINTNDSIGNYIKRWILDHDAELYRQLLMRISLPWGDKPQLLLLLDGINEIPDQHRVYISNEIKLWSEYPGIQIIISSRFDVKDNLSSVSNFTKIELQPLSKKTVDDYLSKINIPIPQDEMVRELIAFPLLLALYTKTEHFRSRSTTFKDANNAGSIIWNYLQSEILRFSNNEENKKISTLALEFIAPYIAWKMQQNSRHHLWVNESSFSVNELDFVCWINESYEQLKKYSYDLNRFPQHIALQIWDEIPEKRFFKTFLETQLCLFVKDEDSKYRLMHQQFRDALAAMHLINMSYLSGNSLPQEWNSPIDSYVMWFVVDLISEDEATMLWEQNRKTTPTIEDATRNQLRLQGLLHNNNYSHLDFSGLDLSNISLYPYRTNNKTIKLPTVSEKMEKTKLSEKTFIAERDSGWIINIAVTQNGKYAISWSFNGTIRIWNLKTGKLKRILEMGPVRLSFRNSFALTPDGNYLFVRGRNGAIRVCNLKTGKLMRRTLPKKGKGLCFTTLAVTPDGKYLVSSSIIEKTYIWNLKTGELMRTLKDTSLVIKITPDGKYIIFFGAYEPNIRIWNIETGVLEKTLNKRSKMIEPIKAAAITPDGKYVIESRFYSEKINIWNLKTGVLAKTLKHEDYIEDVAVTPNGKCIVSGCHDNTIRVWDLRTGVLIKTLKRCEKTTDSIAITPNGKYVISTNKFTICITDIDTDEVETIHVLPLSLVDLDFSKAEITDDKLKETLRQNGAKV